MPVLQANHPAMGARPVSTAAVGERQQAHRDSISAAALRLFVAQGYGQTTVDDIARAAHVSRATVFRHFGSKEDIVFARYREQLASTRAADTRRGSDGERARRLLLDLAARLAAHPEPFLSEVHLIASTPPLRARAILILHDWGASLAGDLALGRPGGAGLRTRVLAQSGVTAFHEAVCVWRKEPESTSLVRLTTDALRVALPG